MAFRPPYFLGVRQQFGEHFFGEGQVFLPISETGFLDNFAGVSTAGLHEVLVTDEEGNTVIRIEPKKRTTPIDYVVRSGDTVAKVAYKFGITKTSLLWANDMNVRQELVVGQDIRIPPTDGVFYTVIEGDTLDKIVEVHNADLVKINLYNKLSADTELSAGQEIFIPDATKTYVENVTTQDGQVEQIRSIGFKLRRPTQGVLTQGFHSRHYAIDIANRMNTPIYASASGKVIKSADGWNYGYGRYVVVDHGNGIRTLYAHMNVRKIEEGAEVKTGQLIGLMGNTGNVFGPTGIHLHYEVHIRNRKVNPFSYF